MNIEKVKEALAACAGIENIVKQIEQYEEYTEGSPMLGTCRGLYEIKKAAKLALSSLAELEKPAEDAESLLSMMFRDIREIGYITEPLRLTNESHEACVALITRYAESYHAERCKDCVEKFTCETCGNKEPNGCKGCYLSDGNISNNWKPHV